MFAGHTKGPGPNMFSCFSTVKQNKNKTKKQILSVDQGGPLFKRGGGEGAIAPRHPGPVRPWGPKLARPFCAVMSHQYIHILDIE